VKSWKTTYGVSLAGAPALATSLSFCADVFLQKRHLDADLGAIDVIKSVQWCVDDDGVDETLCK
jgi:hypothetical protein